MGVLTGADLQLGLALRLGETTAPSDATTKNQRYSWLTRGYFNLSRRRNWFWQEALNTTNVNTGAANYPEPTDLKDFIELKINNVFYDLIPYNQNRVFVNSLGVVTLPSLRRSFKFYRFGGNYTLIPLDGNDAAVHNIRYWKRVAKISLDSDTFLIPDEYTEALEAFAEGRYWMSISQQAKAVAPFQEYEEIVNEMVIEQGRKGWGSAGGGIQDPEQAYGQTVGSY